MSKNSKVIPPLATSVFSVHLAFTSLGLVDACTQDGVFTRWFWLVYTNLASAAHLVLMIYIAVTSFRLKKWRCESSVYWMMVWGFASAGWAAFTFFYDFVFIIPYWAPGVLASENRRVVGALAIQYFLIWPGIGELYRYIAVVYKRKRKRY